MSNQAEMTTALVIDDVNIVRDSDELEGALLPVATAVGGDGIDVGGGVSAAPQSTFEYGTAIAIEQQQLLVQPPRVEQQHEEQIAYNVPPTGSTYSSAITDDSRTRVRQAQNVGLMASEQEKEAIRRANTNVFAKGYHTEVAIKEANEVAQARARSDHYHDLLQQQMATTSASLTSGGDEDCDSSSSKRKTKKDKEQQQGGGGYKEGGGYEVNEYQFGTDYDVSEYKMSEYKSVYD